MKHVSKDTGEKGGREEGRVSDEKAQNWEPCLSISKAAFTPASPSAIWRCEGADEQEAAQRGFCVMESSQVSVLVPVIVNTRINIVF